MMWGFGGVFFILCMAFMIWMMFGHGMMGHGHGDMDHKGADTPERILAERFASGEIDTEEYEQRLEALGRRDRSARK
jgi:uncharacterized membrane protein